MTQYTIVNPTALASGQPEDITVVLSNFQALAAVINGNLDNSNLTANAAVAISKLQNYPANAAKYLRGDGQWSDLSSVPAGPVVNGQFIKGVGGAAVWSAIAHNDLPSEFGASGGTALPSPPGNDWNQATVLGWYSSSSGANAPAGVPGSWLQVRVESHASGQWVTQTGWAFTYLVAPSGQTIAGRYRRYQYSGSWSAWKLLDDADWQQMVLLDSWTNYPGYTLPAAYRKLGGIVTCRGLVNRASPPGPGSTIAVLAAGYRPGSTMMFHLPSGSGGTTRFDVNADGSIVFGNESTASAAPQGYTSLTPLTFYGEL